MSEFDLSRLNGQSFERLVRALALKALGDSGTVYSPGADAGRDFVLEGKTPGYEARGWDGYVVLQAKYREPQTGDPVAWLLRQIEKEKQAFLDRKRGRRTPAYYIVVTNIPLSGADGPAGRGKLRKGGHAKVSEALEGWKKSVGIKDFDIWPEDKIAALLSGNPDVRRTYAAWVTPGDVLTELLEVLAHQRPDFGSTIRRALLNALRRNQFTALKDAGSVTDQKIRTSQVFVDVPYTTGTVNSSELAETQNKRRVARHIASRSKERLDPESIAARRALEASKRPYRNRIVILGGPGQGKSTVSSFVAQYFRASLAVADAASQFDEVIQALAPEILARANHEGVSDHVPRRYPVLVSLPRFADAVSRARGQSALLPTLLSFIAHTLGEDADGEIIRDDLRLWLSEYPWIIVLDGLDEVPPAGERAAVLDAIAGLITEVNDARGDVLIVVTTRPQGYNHDLDPANWDHLTLDELPVERAIAYAEALGVARYPDDRTRRGDVHEKIVAASAEAATKRLMVTPLQVTILYLIVDTGGSAPTARWTLFHEYYEVLKRREKAKGGKVQEVIERNIAHIGPIHQRAGIVLQAVSEVEGSAQSTLNRISFEALTKAYLIAAGFVGEDLAVRTSELTDLALNRLVFLSAREEGAISFDVRSLQEFMAAAALTAGEADDVEARLLHIAGISHWRHCFLIAASRCFAEDAFHHRRQVVVGIPRALEATTSDYCVRNGARLAYDMFKDGIGADFPIYRNMLGTHALELLAIGVPAYEARLENLDEPTLHDILVGAVMAALSREVTQQSKAAWRVLLALASRDESLVDAVASNWPTDVNTAFRLLRDVHPELGTGSFHSWLLAEFKRQPASRALYLARIKDQQLSHDRETKQWAHSLFPRWSGGRPTYIEVRIEGVSNITLHVTSVCNTDYFIDLWTHLRGYKLSDYEVAAYTFATSPSKESLSAALAAAALAEKAQMAWIHLDVPWPLGMLLNFRENIDFAAAATEAANGLFGDTADWRAAELRWERSPLGEADILAMSDEWPYTASVASVGAPDLKAVRIAYGAGTVQSINALVRLAGSSSSKWTVSRLCRLIGYLHFDPDHAGVVDNPEVLLDLLLGSCPESLSFGLIWKAWLDSNKSIDIVAKMAEVACHPVEMELDDPGTVSSELLVVHRANRNLRSLAYLSLLVRSEEDTESAVEPWEGDLYVRDPTDPPHVRISNLCFISRARALGPISADMLAEDFRELANKWDQTELSSFVHAVVHSKLLPDDLLTEVLMRLLANIPISDEDHGHSTMAYIKTILDRRRSNLLRPDIWSDRLHLPADVPLLQIISPP